MAAKLYYAYHVKEIKNELWLEFHTGSDREEVRQGKSFNHGLQVYPSSSDKFKEVFENWETQINVFKMERA